MAQTFFGKTTDGSLKVFRDFLNIQICSMKEVTVLDQPKVWFLKFCGQEKPDVEQDLYTITWITRIIFTVYLYVYFFKMIIVITSYLIHIGIAY